MPLTFDDDKTSLFNFAVRDGHGVKGVADLSLPKVPHLYIQPPQNRINNLPTKSLDLPPIDLSKLDGPDCHLVAQQIVEAAENLGFFQVVNHGVPVEVLESLKEAAHGFFGQPPEKKAAYLEDLSSSPLVTYGTSFAPGKETALEWMDYFTMIYTNDEEALQYWPEECGKVILEYLKTSTNMVKKLMEVLILNLGVTLEASKVDALITSLIGSKIARMNYYPACPDPDLTIGIGRHSDLGTLTVLVQDGIGGLYIKVDQDFDFAKKGEWLEIPPRPNALVINIGDSLQILSNGKYKSVEHRVRTTNASSRVSIPIFLMPKSTEKIAPLPEMIEKDGVARYREIIYGDYKTFVFGNAHQGKKSLEYAQI